MFFIFVIRFIQDKKYECLILLNKKKINYNLGSPLERFGSGGKYEDIFVTALKNHGILCIGLYR